MATGGSRQVILGSHYCPATEPNHGRKVGKGTPERRSLLHAIPWIGDRKSRLPTKAEYHRQQLRRPACRIQTVTSPPGRLRRGRFRELWRTGDSATFRRRRATAARPPNRAASRDTPWGSEKGGAAGGKEEEIRRRRPPREERPRPPERRATARVGGIRPEGRWSIPRGWAPFMVSRGPSR